MYTTQASGRNEHQQLAILVSKLQACRVCLLHSPTQSDALSIYCRYQLCICWSITLA